MKLAFLIIAVFALTACATQERIINSSSREAEIVRMAQQIAGVSASACGVLHSKNYNNPAISCADHRPFWFAVNYEADGWWAVAIPVVGLPRLIHPADRYRSSSSPLVTETCQKLVLNEIYDREPITCLHDGQDTP